MPDLQMLQMCPTLEAGDPGELRRPGGVDVAVQITHFDGVYVYETRSFNRYRVRDDPAHSSEIRHPWKSLSWEQRYDDSRCVTVVESWEPITKRNARIISQYVEVWLFDSELRDHYRKYASLPSGALVTASDITAGFMIVGGANPASTAGGAVFATVFYLTTLGYGALTNWGGTLYQKEWRDYGYCVETAESEWGRRRFTSDPHPCTPSEAERREAERRRAQREYDDAERERAIERSRREHPVEWGPDE